MANNFFQKYAEIAEKNPSKVLLRIDDNELTYSDFLSRTAKMASGMRNLGVKTNDKVGIIMPNSIEWYIVFWSAVRIGAQPVPIDPQSGVLELTRLIPSTTVKICFASVRYKTNSIKDAVMNVEDDKLTAEKIIFFGDETGETFTGKFMSSDDFFSSYTDDYSEIFVPEKDHIMSLACTSGSTGTPKMLSVPYYGFYEAAVDMGKYLNFTENEVMMLGMTLYHQGGFGMGLQTTVNGGTVMYQPQFNPVSFLETVQKYHVTVIQLTSTLAKVLLSTPDFDKYDLSCVKACYFAGEVLPKEIADVFVEKLGIRVINVIGSSETATMVVWDSDKDRGTDPSDFRKLPFTDFIVADADGNDITSEDEVGELCIYTTAVITDYFANPELTAEKIRTDKDGRRWFLTGDLVKRIPGGKVRFAGRSKRIIKRGGNLVHAEEVEACLLTNEKIAAAAVTDDLHPVIGQQIIAYVQTVDNQKITRGEIARFFEGKLSAYKVPDKVIVVDEIPKDVGKIQFKYLREKK
ncbi:MAG: acyl--CoA ligase [Oscillospiraceae bacterium]|nr:acyl--CoA ligase [Oscillospiraceae bacterium]